MMKKQQNSSTCAAALQITFTVALLFSSAIWLAGAARPPIRRKLPGQAGSGFIHTGSVAAPVLGNYPDTSLALSRDTTVTPDAAPSDTTSINVSTSTDFNGTLAGDPTTGVVRVTDAHPAGTYTVTVTAFDSGGATATKTFTLTVTTPVTCNPVYFAPATNFPLSSAVFSVAVGDFNRDGNQDLAATNEFSNTVSILLGDGTGNFSGPTNFPVDDTPVSVAVGDFNGDGHQDLAVANDLIAGTVSILLGDGTGNFGAPTNFPADTEAWSVAVGDFNGDGNQDLAVANLSSDNVSILLGDGAGNFSAATNFAAGTSPSSVAVGDFNGDGQQDLATTNGGSGSVSILLGDGTGNFSAATNFPGGFGPSSVAVGDFNGDGQQDVAVASAAQPVGSVSILLRDCPATLLRAASRLTHRSAGAFDINMPLTGTSGVEDRSASTYNAVFTFDAPVTSGEVTVLSGTATVGAITFSGNEMTAALTGVTDVQTVVLHTQNINGDGQPHGDVSFSFLIGDVDGNRTVAKPDGNQVKTDKNESVNASNFRDDINLSGVVDKPDYNLIKANQGHRLP